MQKLEDHSHAMAWTQGAGARTEELLWAKLKKVDVAKKPGRLVSLMSDIARARPWPKALAARLEDMRDACLGCA